MTTEEKLTRARDLMAQKQYTEARNLLWTIRDHPQAESWLMTIAQLGDTDAEKPKRGEFYDDQDSTPRRSRSYDDTLDEREDSAPARGRDYDRRRGDVRVYQRLPGGSKNYLTIAIITLIAYLVFWLIGIILNLVYLGEARKLQKEGADVQNAGCLWALLIFAVAPCLAVLVLVSLGPDIAEVFSEIQTQMFLTPGR